MLKNGVVNELASRKKSLGQRLRLVNGKFLCIVTGAGKGLGRAIANLVFQEGGIHPLGLAGSRLILIDKDMESLRETSGKKMKQFLKHRKIEVELICADLGDMRRLKETLADIITKYDKDFEEVILINNVSTLGDISRFLIENTDFGEIQEFFDINIISKVYFTTEIFNGFAPSKKTIVNVINYDTLQPNMYLGLPYMATSAIRSFSEVFAKENPKTKVLVFEASRVDSTSTQEILENCPDEELVREILAQQEKNQLRQPSDVAKKLSKIFEEHKYEPGKAYIWNENLEQCQ